jgi:hypothetical protein
MGIGFDVGTFHLVCARRGEGDEIRYNKQINSFITLPLENRAFFKLMHAAKAPLIEREDVAYMVGQAD